MEGDTGDQPQAPPAPLGSVEPHAGLLKVPALDAALYKMMTVEHLLRSMAGNYLHFNRVDAYADFPGADAHDGRQLPGDQPGNAGARFIKSPEFSAADYYDRSRSRTYACCFSLEKSEFIWSRYANGSARGKVCVEFEFGKLRATLNHNFEPGNAALEYGGLRCHQIFSINYGCVDYVDWDRHRANQEHLPNPIAYTYLKAMRYRDERELRISLSAIGIGQFRMKDGSVMEFPPSLQVPFDFRRSISEGAVRRIVLGPGADGDVLRSEMYALRIVPK